MNLKSIIDGLNEEQKSAALDFYGASFILAGPGAGKTKTLVSRTANMIAQGIPAESIILFTFTNKAAKEIKERIINTIGDEGKKIMIGTYHSICVRFLRQYADRLPPYTKNFSIFDSEESGSILKKICKREDKLDYKEVASFISKSKRKRVTPKMALEQNRGNAQIIGSAYRDYQKELHLQGAMDFDDLVLNFVEILNFCPDVLQKVNSRYQYIVADEFHDSSSLDVELIRLLAGENQNVCMILDPDQSIYAFRGARLDTVLGVQKYFDNMKTFVLNQNYRSTQTIVNAACSLISHNPTTLEKNLFSDNDIGEPVIFFKEDSQAKEAFRVVQLVKLLKSNYGLNYKDIAILYRMNSMSRSIEEAFIPNSIPYQIVGGCPFAARKEIKDILSYVKVMKNPFDLESFTRAVNTPKRGVGAKAIESIKEYSRTHYNESMSLLDAARNTPLKGKAKQGVDDFINYIDVLQQRYEEHQEPGDFIKNIIQETDYMNHINKTEKTETERETKIEMLTELLNIAYAFDNINDFLENMTLDSATLEVEEETDDKVNLLSGHSSKGLEYEAVIIIGCNEGTSPHFRALEAVKDMEEERRLFYVAMTRAKKYLFLTRPNSMLKMGRTVYCKESRFIKEINKKYIKRFT